MSFSVPRLMHFTWQIKLTISRRINLVWGTKRLLCSPRSR